MNEVENYMARPLEDNEPKVVTFCYCCDEELTEQDTFLNFEGEYFCEDSCFIQYMGVTKIEGWQI